MSEITGMSDLLFEVMYGVEEGLYSKTQDIMKELLYFYEKDYSKCFSQTLRCLLLKMINEVDTEKHILLWEMLTTFLDYKNKEQSVNLILLVTKDAVRLKFGRRVN